MTQTYTVARLYNDNDVEEHSKVIAWANSTLSAEELADFNLALQRNSQRYNYLLANNLVVEEPIYQEFFSNVLQANITLQVGDRVTYKMDIGNMEKFDLDPGWSNYLARYFKQLSYQN